MVATAGRLPDAARGGDHDLLAEVRRSGPAKGEPLGDVDAPTKAVLDVLAAAGVVPDDAVFRRVVLVNAYDKAAPRIEVRLGNDAAGGVVAGA